MSSHKVSHRLKFEDLKKDRTRRIHLIREFGHKCWICGLSEWCEKPIPLELDHVSGDTNDNRKENLRVICPNCHAQTPTYKAKNRASFKRKQLTKKYPRSRGVRDMHARLLNDEVGGSNPSESAILGV